MELLPSDVTYNILNAAELYQLVKLISGPENRNSRKQLGDLKKQSLISNCFCI